MTMPLLSLQTVTSAYLDFLFRVIKREIIRVSTLTTKRTSEGVVVTGSPDELLKLLRDLHPMLILKIDGLGLPVVQAELKLSMTPATGPQSSPGSAG